MLKELMETVGEVDRIVAHWQERGAKMSRSELRYSISHELEMLEYEPDQVEALLPQILDRVKS